MLANDPADLRQLARHNGQTRDHIFEELVGVGREMVQAGVLDGLNADIRRGGVAGQLAERHRGDEAYPLGQTQTGGQGVQFSCLPPPPMKTK